MCFVDGNGYRWSHRGIRLLGLVTALSLGLWWSGGIAQAGANIPINGEVKFSCPSNGTPVSVTAFTFLLDGTSGTSGAITSVWNTYCGSSATSNCQPFPNSPATGTFSSFPINLVWDGTTKMLNVSAYSNPTYHYGYAIGEGLNHTVSGAYAYKDASGNAQSCVVIPPFNYTGQANVTLPTATAANAGIGRDSILSLPYTRRDQAQGADQSECGVALGIALKGSADSLRFHRKARFTVWGVNLGPDNVGIAERLGLLVGDSPLLREDPLVDTVLMVADSEGRPLSPLVCAEQEATVGREYVVAVSWSPRSAWSGSGSGSTVYTLISQEMLADGKPAATPTPSRRQYLPLLSRQ